MTDDSFPFQVLWRDGERLFRPERRLDAEERSAQCMDPMECVHCHIARQPVPRDKQLKSVPGPVPLGERDTPDRLLIPEKLYGRERDIEALLACLDRVVRGGAAQLVLVSGYSGIGKSSVVNELQKVLVPPGGLFAAAKFDQYKRDTPMPL